MAETLIICHTEKMYNGARLKMRLSTKIILTAILIISLVFAVCPVSGYTLLYSDDLHANLNASPTAMPGEGFHIYVRDAVGFTNVTHIEITNIKGYRGGNLTGTYGPCPLIGGDALTHGNASMSTSWSALGTYSATGSYIIDILDFDALGNVGSKGYLMQCSPTIPSSNTYLYNLGSQFPGTAFLPSTYAAVPGTNDNNVLNATYNFYGGSPAVIKYSNATVNIKSNSTGLNIPRATVTIQYRAGSSVTGTTNMEGNFTPSPGVGLEFDSSFIPYVNGYKVGYQAKNQSTGWDTTQDPLYFSMSLDDVVTPPGGIATVYLDIADLSTKQPITGATVGIMNTTATIDPWTYATYSDSTIPFNSTGVYPNKYNLSVGQTVEFAGYKTSTYVANHTGSYIIPSTVSHLTLYLSPVSGNETSTYNFPVTIVDSTTGYSIANSYLNQSTQAGIYYNRSSANGKFNVTGTGPLGTQPIVEGDVFIFTASASGYQGNGMLLAVNQANNGITQFINLAPNSLVPIAGQFSAVANVYDYRTSASLSGVSLTVTALPNYTASKSSSSSGGATFPNLTAGTQYTITASKTGYTTLSQSFTGNSKDIIYLDLPMSQSSINPTPTATAYPTPSRTITALPTTSGGKYTGFFGPIGNWFAAMGADFNFVATLLAFFLIFVGAVIGGWSNAPYSANPSFNMVGAGAGALLGFLLAVAAGLISIVLVVVFIFAGIFIWIFFR